MEKHSQEKKRIKEGLNGPWAREELTKVVAALEVSFFFPYLPCQGLQQTLLYDKT